ncbi:hypothetical protein [Runella salmonicolor]|uniref:Uncharacterized protein n=1 Tax=Runella salmonicolor TaxID=2950278 RepID=A0ABT1FUY2_9BACT|nr:hypothetical protein [Runella salmonicolor]MCP1385575.1 hypothetical protein [Runella salmonicolor]
MPPVYRIIARSFAPFGEFGHFLGWGESGIGGFEGDNRGFSNDLNASSRIKSTLSFTLLPAHYIGDIVHSDRSEGRGFSPVVVSGLTGFLCDVIGTTGEVFRQRDIVQCRERDYEWREWLRPTVTSREFSSGSSSFSIRGDTITMSQIYHGSNPLVDVFAGDIDVSHNFTITRNMVGDRLSSIYIQGRLSGDRFPFAEVLLADSDDNVILLHTYRTDWGPNTGPVVALPFDGRADMGSYGVNVNLNSRGRITGVSIADANAHTMRTIERSLTISEWNGRFMVR